MVDLYIERFGKSYRTVEDEVGADFVEAFAGSSALWEDWQKEFIQWYFSGTEGRNDPQFRWKLIPRFDKKFPPTPPSLGFRDEVNAAWFGGAIPKIRYYRVQEGSIFYFDAVNPNYREGTQSKSVTNTAMRVAYTFLHRHSRLYLIREGEHSPMPDNLSSVVSFLARTATEVIVGR